MSLVDHTRSFEVPYVPDDTFEALKIACSKIDGFSINRFEAITRTIYLKTGVSLFSWGEDITVDVRSSLIGSEVGILSTPKTGILFGGTMDMGKNRKNIAKISEALSIELFDYKQVEISTQPAKEPSSIADEITKLAKLKEQGILTDEEFVAKKKQLLGL
jgi:hypothetical protein